MSTRLEKAGMIAITAVTAASILVPLAMIKSYQRECFQYKPIMQQPIMLVPDVPMEPLVRIPVDNVEEPVDNFVEEPVENTSYADEELEILAIIIYQEAGSDRCSDDTRRKVGSVFINRVNSTRFPDTFEEVATQERQYGTLHWTGIKWPDRAVNKYEAHAVERAYKIAEDLLVNGTVLPDNVIWQAEFIQGDGIYCYQDNFYFCYTEEN